MTPNQILKERLEFFKLRRADPASYIRYLCKKTIERTNNIELPSLTPDENEELMKNLVAYECLNEKDSLTRLINISDAFKIINKMEKNIELRIRIRPIIEWLNHYQQIIIEIQDPRNRDFKEIINRELHSNIQLFNGLYHNLIDENAPKTTEYTNLLENEEEDVKQ